MTPREFVADTAQKLLDQGGYAIDKEGLTCAYRAPDGKKCAIGQHIPDEMYNALTDIEGRSVGFLTKNYPEFLEHFSALTNLHDKWLLGAFLYRVQKLLHDSRAQDGGAPLLTVAEALELFDAGRFMTYVPD